MVEGSPDNKYSRIFLSVFWHSRLGSELPEWRVSNMRPIVLIKPEEKSKMRTQSAAQKFHRIPRKFVLGGIILLALAAIALPFYSASSRSSAALSPSVR